MRPSLLAWDVGGGGAGLVHFIFYGIGLVIVLIILFGLIERFIPVVLLAGFLSGCGNRAPVDPAIVEAQARIYQALAGRIEARTAAETPIPPPEFPPIPISRPEDKIPVPERIAEPSFSSRLGASANPFE